MSRLRQLGRMAAEVQDRRKTREDTLGRVEARLLGTAETAGGFAAHSRSNARRMVAAAVLIPALVGAAWMYWAHGAPLALSINGKLQTQDAKGVIETEAGRFDALQFSDGSQIQVIGESRTQCLKIEENGAHILLERGRLQATIVPSADTRWRFEAGPYTVRVKGTQFGLLWDPMREELTVEMFEGSVRVDGPMPGQSRTVTAGERLSARAKQREVAVTLWSKAEQVEEQPLSPTADKALPEEQAEAITIAAKSDDKGGTRESRRGGKPKQDPKACLRTDGEKTLRYADGERRKGNLDAAFEAYQEIWDCDAKSREASIAAFRLGKIAFDSREDSRAAVLWFERFLSAPKDVGLMREAYGRLLEALIQTNERTKAAKIAREYLVRYPSGPHASLAKRVEEEFDSLH